MKLNEKGSSQIFLCLLLLLALSGVTALVLNKVIHLKKNRLRYSSLLCLRESQYYEAKFITEVNSINLLLVSTLPFKYSGIPYVAQAANATIKLAKIKQQYSLFKFYRKVYSLKNCSTITKAIIIQNLPFDLNFKTTFKRDNDETTTLKLKKFSIRYFSIEKVSLKIRPIIFKSTFTLDNNLDTEVSIYTREESI
ncbi:hypothetical protein A9Q84_09265 [Halobacteriovorax marinus]|uniref:Uncharacterized protein n=1 Tax=Halobacteriovorax marinus TaxID=97084 RepID=A0A1Y5F6K1_9BACT|nr:hypothetical protein A9Q84_09265 [Halobacteriovorax marinus]